MLFKQKQEIFNLINDLAFYGKIKDYNFSEVQDLEELAFKLLTDYIMEETGTVELAVIGNFSIGKSTFINSLFCKRICPTAVNPTTSTITKFLYGEIEEIYLIKENSKKEVCQHIIGKKTNSESFEIHYYYPFDILKSITIYDTPGFNNPQNDTDQLITEKISKSVDIVMLLVDINNGGVKDDDLMTLLEQISKANPNLRWYYILNKCDTKSPNKIDKLMSEVKMKYGERFNNYFFYSLKEILNEFENNKTPSNLNQVSIFFKEKVRIITEFNALSELKNEIKRKNLAVNQDEYLKKIMVIIKQLQKNINLLIQNSVITENMNKFNKIYENITKFYSSKINFLMRDLVKEIKKKIEVSEKNDTYYGRNESIFVSMISSVRNFFNDEKEVLIHIDKLPKNIKQKFISLVSETLNKFINEFKSFINLDIRYYMVDKICDDSIVEINKKLNKIINDIEDKYADSEEEEADLVAEVIAEIEESLINEIKPLFINILNNFINKTNEQILYHQGKLQSNIDNLKKIAF